MKNMQINRCISPLLYIIHILLADVISTIFFCDFLYVQRAVRAQTQSLISLYVILLYPSSNQFNCHWMCGIDPCSWCAARTNIITGQTDIFTRTAEHMSLIHSTDTYKLKHIYIYSYFNVYSFCPVLSRNWTMQSKLVYNILQHFSSLYNNLNMNRSLHHMHECNNQGGLTH